MRYIIPMLTLCVGLLIAPRGTAQHTTFRTYAVGCYNLENLFDPYNDTTNVGDDEFLPHGPYRWTEGKYERKLGNLAFVLRSMARRYTPYGPAAIGVSEVENRRVLEDLVSRQELASMGLSVIHEDGPDRRGIDVALLYNPHLFHVAHYSYHRYPKLETDSTFVTRDQLLVEGELGGDSLAIIVCHWPSRYGGSRSTPLRERAAELTLRLVDSLQAKNANKKIIILGDFNDDPVNSSLSQVLKAKRRKTEVQPLELFNTTWPLFARGIGSLAYQGKWNLFDQIIVNEPLLRGPAEPGLRYWYTEIGNLNVLTNQSGRRKGNPHRTFEGNSFIDGYSDHYPVWVYLTQRM